MKPAATTKKKWFALLDVALLGDCKWSDEYVISRKYQN